MIPMIPFERVKSDSLKTTKFLLVDDFSCCPIRSSLLIHMRIASLRLMNARMLSSKHD
jgi:hypothetical protein